MSDLATMSDVELYNRQNEAKRHAENVRARLNKAEAECRRFDSEVHRRFRVMVQTQADKALSDGRFRQWLPA